jgi:D-alanyl-D-alanine carboxypeptidase/D-alanyl-D-alanine-endopeptidase (penicillin-binding protein 4)
MTFRRRAGLGGPLRGSRRAALRLPSIVIVTLVAVGCHGTPTPAVLPTPPPPPARSAPPAPPALFSLISDIDDILAAPALERSYWGIFVRSLRTDEVLYARNARKLLMPASNMKIVTLAAAAERLGWDYTYETKVIANGPIASGTLDGDLVVIGSGDPSLGLIDGTPTAVFDEWAEQLKARGIRSIRGRIVGNDNVFDDDMLGFGWSWDDLFDDYAAGVSALQFNENAAQVTVTPGAHAGDPAPVAMTPAGSGLLIDNLLKTSAEGTPAAIAARRLAGSSRLELRGSIPAGAAPIARLVSVDNPTLFTVSALREALIAHGIDVRGQAVDADDVDIPVAFEATPVVAYRSPPLSVLAVRLMKTSQNLYAETLLKTIGLTKLPEAVKQVSDVSDTCRCAASAADGRDVVRIMLQAWGVTPESMIQRDGSGLSRYDYLTAEALVTILMHVYRDETLRGPFEASLPMAGRDGTIGNRMKGTAAEGNARAKSGSMSNVRALSGYVTSADGEPLAFSIIANNFETAADVNRATDAIVVRLAAFTRR